MRPIIYDVTLTHLTILFPGRPHMVASLKLRGAPDTIEEANRIAARDFAGMDSGDLELVREIATPLTVVVSEPEPVLAGVVQRVYQEPRYAGAVHCPGCGGKIGKGDSPSIGYVRSCHHCRGTLDIQFHEGGIVVVFVRGE
jgi:hypothetical protein